MRYENKKWFRDDRYFRNQDHAFDLSNIRFLHTGVDTVKELFNCLLKPEMLLRIHEFYENNSQPIIIIGEYSFLISKSSKASGFQWILRNNDLGFVVLLKSFFVDAGENGTQIKIEGSPHVINRMTPKQYSNLTKEIAGLFATQIKPIGCAVHLCVDVKGWKPSNTFEYDLVTRSKRRMGFAGISNVSFDMAECAAIYGNRQTYTFGSASGVQLCVYDKVTEAIKTDKIDYWVEQWEQIPSVHDILEKEYQDGDQVTRIEGRIHHSVIAQFCNGTLDKDGKNIVINDFNDCSEHLTALWQYVLNSHRLQFSSSYIDPFWQLLQEDVYYFKPAPDLLYKRTQKTAENVNVKRKTAIWLGNTIRLHARKRINAKTIVKYILRMNFDDELSYYFGLPYPDKDTLGEVLLNHVELKLHLLLLQGVAA